MDGVFGQHSQVPGLEYPGKRHQEHPAVPGGGDGRPASDRHAVRAAVGAAQAHRWAAARAGAGQGVRGGGVEEGEETQDAGGAVSWVVVIPGGMCSRH